MPLSAVNRSSRKLCKALSTSVADGDAVDEAPVVDVLLAAVELVVVLAALLVAGVAVDAAVVLDVVLGVTLVAVLVAVLAGEADDAVLEDDALGARPNWLNAWNIASKKALSPSP